MRIAICQLDIQYEQKEKNIDHANDFVENAKSQNAELILFPEMSFTGFSMNTELTGEQDKYTIGRMKELALQYQIGIGFGWVKKQTESKDMKAQNHYTILDEKGNVLTDYCKIHPFSYSGEDQFFQAGSIPGEGRFHEKNLGISICYDLRFPEIYQYLSKKAEIILVPANWPMKRREHWRTLLRARAIETQSYMIGINCVGEQNGLHYSGDSAVISPLGDILCEMEEKEELQVITIPDDVANIRLEFPVKKDRQERLYQTFYDVT